MQLPLSFTHLSLITTDPPMENWRFHRANRTTPPALLADAGGWGGLPVDPSALARKMGVTVRMTEGNEGPNWSGALEFVRGEPVIWVRHTDSRTHQRFTVAHEIGHLVLHPGIQRLHRDVTYSGNKRERDANKYAAELLMPVDIVAPMSRTHSLRELARLFDVSETAMQYRLMNLGIR